MPPDPDGRDQTRLRGTIRCSGQEQAKAITLRDG
jgi:hypothetical protein